MMALWRRYILFSSIKSYLFIFFCLYMVYTLFDFSLHIGALSLSDSAIKQDIGLYYLCQISKRQMILSPLAFLLSLVATLGKLNHHNELLALQVAGLSKRKIIQPFLLIAFVISIFQLINYEFFLPSSHTFIEKFEQSHLKTKKKHKSKKSLQVLSLEDGTRLVYQRYIHAEKSFYDVYWIKNSSDIWRMHKLASLGDIMLADQAVHLVRNDHGFHVEEMANQKDFSDFALKNKLQKKGFIPLKARALSELFYQALTQKKISLMQKQAVRTHLCFKFVISTFALLLSMIIIPFCLKYKRGGSIFLIYSLSIFSFIALVFIMNSLLILGEANILAPTFSMLIPCILVFGICSINLKRNLG